MRDKEIEIESLQSLIDELTKTLGDESHFSPKGKKEMEVTVTGDSIDEVQKGLDAAQDVIGEMPGEPGDVDDETMRQLVKEKALNHGTDGSLADDLEEEIDEVVEPEWDDIEEDPEEVKRLVRERFAR